MHFCYILYSPSKNRFYIGETENLSRRLIEHNLHTFKSASTVIADDWQVYLSIEMPDRSKARNLEKFIKKMKSQTFIQKLKSDCIFKSEIITRFK